jgi:hypothetical protein
VDNHTWRVAVATRTPHNYNCGQVWDKNYSLNYSAYRTWLFALLLEPCGLSTSHAQLHRLPVGAHIEFNVAFLTFKTLTFRQPPDLLNSYVSIHQSDNKAGIVIADCLQSVSKPYFPNCAFCHVAPACSVEQPPYAYYSRSNNFCY